MPITLSGRLVDAAILVMEMEDVLEARMMSEGAAASMSLKILNFSSGFSVAASMMRSAFRAVPRSETNVIASAFAFCSAVRLPFSSSFAVDLPMAA